jgi:hypothetical protein
MTVGTRPANAGGNLLNLDTLGEGEEEEKEISYEPRATASIR